VIAGLRLSYQQQSDNGDDYESAFPRFLAIKSDDRDHLLSGVSPFIAQRDIQALGAKIDRIDTAGACLLVKVDYKPEADKLLTLTRLADLPVSVSPHRTIAPSTPARFDVET